MKNVFFKELGSIEYKKAWDVQEKLFNETLAVKSQNRKEPPGFNTRFTSFKKLSIEA